MSEKKAADQITDAEIVELERSLEIEENNQRTKCGCAWCKVYDNSARAAVSLATVRKLIARIRSQEATIQEFRKDAERYQYIRMESMIHKPSRRNGYYTSMPTFQAQPTNVGIPFDDNFDQAVDVAREATIQALKGGK